MFLEGVELKALEGTKDLNWQRRDNTLDMEWHEQKFKVENGVQEQENCKILALARMGVESRR